ncbi:MAG TPA: CPBP family intramembrane glutamic endopeptidase [Candidatus Limnocylindrales bacterium]|nr:CPBP family intramembrane glutamic endopeptidase [Candidatus Limnocylindrales bacterium]
MFGLDLPLRASVAILAASALLLADYTGLLRWDPSARGVSLERFVLFGLVPVAIVVVLFRDDVARYGLRLGDWRWGIGLLAGGMIVMTPIILFLAGTPAFVHYYGARPLPLADAIVNNVLELFPAEFLLRGFLMFALWRRVGPLALVIVQVPFVFSHIGKPELELWSTFVGGSVFAWLDWRTGSIVWSAFGHLFVLTLMLVAVGATS